MLSLISQLACLWNLIIGIVAASAASDSVNADNKKGKFDFWYQWRNSIISATAWRYLRTEGYKHYSSYPEHKATVAVRFLPDHYIARQSPVSREKGSVWSPQPVRTSWRIENSIHVTPRFVVISALSLMIYHLHYPGCYDGTERAN
jgi:hypothetical protein